MTVVRIDPERTHLAEQLRASQENELLLLEQISDLELALDDKGWDRFAFGLTDEFSPEGRRRIRGLCRMMAISNPMLKGALNTRIGYIWGQGVEVRAKHGADSEGDGGQDVNAVVQTFWDANDRSLTGSQAQEENERTLGTDGEVYLAAFTDPLTGRVLVRVPPDEEVVDVIRNPDDRDEIWYFVREYVEETIGAGTAPAADGATLPLTNRLQRRKVRVVHPAMGYVPTPVRPNNIGGVPIRWDVPILQVTVNRLNGWKHGIPDVYASLAWARLYKDFLVDWATLTKALSKIAYQATGDTKGRAQAAALNASRAAEGDAGQAWVNGPGGRLEAVSKSGATIDSESGKPLAAMVAAGLSLPVTVLLGDPGVTGARAVAETLDLPTILAMGMRRLLWQANLSTLLSYVIEQAVIAPQGPLKGTLYTDEYGQRRVQLAGDATTDLDWDWPPISDIDPVQLVAAIVDADGTGKMPPLTTLRLLLSALGVEDIDDLIKGMTDADGNFIDPKASAGQQAAQQFRAGADPAADFA